MKTKKMFLMILVAMVFVMTTTCWAEESIRRYGGNISWNFQFDRRVEILFSPEWDGTHESRIFYGQPNVSSTRPSPPEGDVAVVKKSGDKKWIISREAGFNYATLKIDEEGKLIFFYPFRGLFAEGELQPMR